MIQRENGLSFTTEPLDRIVRTDVPRGQKLQRDGAPQPEDQQQPLARGRGRNVGANAIAALQ